MFAKLAEFPFDKRSWLKLARSENIGSKTFTELLRLFKTPENAIEKIPYLAEQGGMKRKISLANDELVNRELEKTCLLYTSRCVQETGLKCFMCKN